MVYRFRVWDSALTRQRKEVHQRLSKQLSRCGYRYLDTASFYQTETYVGEAVKESKIPREEFFLVSKVWKDEMGYDNTLRAFEQTLKNLQTDYLDLYLIHWPKPSPDL